MHTLLQDLRYGARMLRTKPGFSLIAVITLALGIGANTAIFSFMNSLFLRPLPVPQPDQLVRLYGEEAGERRFDVFSYPNYADLRDRSQSFARLAAHQYAAVNLSTGAGAESMQGELVTGNYFDILGVNALRGRTLLTEDDSAPGAHPVVVIVTPCGSGASEGIPTPSDRSYTSTAILSRSSVSCRKSSAAHIKPSPRTFGCP